jgi:hypothetical protein
MGLTRGRFVSFLRAAAHPAARAPALPLRPRPINRPRAPLSTPRPRRAQGPLPRAPHAPARNPRRRGAAALTPPPGRAAPPRADLAPTLAAATPAEPGQPPPKRCGAVLRQYAPRPLPCKRISPRGGPHGATLPAGGAARVAQGRRSTGRRVEATRWLSGCAPCASEALPGGRRPQAVEVVCPTFALAAAAPLLGARP